MKLLLHLKDVLAGYPGKFLPALSRVLLFCFLDLLATPEQNSLQWLPSTSKAPLGLNIFYYTFISLFWGWSMCILGITGQLAVFGSVLLLRGPQRLNSDQWVWQQAPVTH